MSRALRTIVLLALGVTTAEIAGGQNQNGQTSGLDPNQESALNAISVLCPALARLGEQRTRPQNDLFRRCGEVLQDSERRPGALGEIARDEVGVMGSNFTEISVGQLENIQGRIQELRQGTHGVSTRGLSVPGFDRLTGRSHRLADAGGLASFPTGLMAQGNERSGRDEAPAVRAERWGFFISGQYATGERDSTLLEPGYDFDGYELTIGGDYRTGPESFFGLAIGYNRTDSDLANDGGSLEVDGTSFSIYGGAGIAEGWFFDWTASYAQNDYDSRSRLLYEILQRPQDAPPGEERQLVTISEVAVGRTDGDTLLASVGLGYEHTSGRFALQPSANVTYKRLEIDGYTERFEAGPGASVDPATGLTFGAGMPLEIADQKIESLLSTLGATFAWTNPVRWGVFVPQIRVEWLHEFDDDSREVITRFANTPDEATLQGLGVTLDEVSFRAFTEDPDRDYFRLGLGFQAVLARGTQLWLFYETIEDLDNISYDAISVGIRFAR